LADLVRRLAEKGLIQRVRLEYAGGDARMYSVSLTKKGESMVEALKPVNDAVNSRLLNVLGDGERAAFIASLAKLADAPLSAYIG
jgi:DNA-binding MarR family transcriptional regulator